MYQQILFGGNAMNKQHPQRRAVFEKCLSDRGIAFQRLSVTNKVKELKDNWFSVFAAGIKTDDIYIEQYLWHIFSYERKKYLSQDAANEAFMQQRKTECFVFFQHKNDFYYLENAEELKPEDFGDLVDVYVVNKRFNWTYVKTHEEELGPYYYSKKMETVP
jgi:hypothetical protein